MGNMDMERRNDTVQGKRVLLVDDDIELLLTWQELLQAHNFETSTAENGTQALRLMQDQEVDAILCDLDMPELSGDLLYSAVGRAWPNLQERFIFITGNAGNPTYENFLQSTRAPVLSKPLSVDVLLEKLQAVLDLEAKPAA